MWKRLKKNIRDWGATLAGIIAAGLTGLATIDFTTFDFNRDKSKLIIMFLIAAGGFFSKFKEKKVKPKENGGDDTGGEAK